MGLINGLTIKKEKNGFYRVTDNKGHSVTGVTKEIAKNKYYVLYGMDHEPKNIGYDMSKVEKKL